MKSLLLLFSILIVFTHLVAAEIEAKRVEVFDDEASLNFYSAYSNKAELVIYEMIEKDSRLIDMKHYKTIKGKGFTATYLVEKDKRLTIDSIHFDASVIHPEDRDKEKLLTRLGIDPKEPASKLSINFDADTLWLTFDGNRLKSVDMQTYSMN